MEAGKAGNLNGGRKELAVAAEDVEEEDASPATKEEETDDEKGTGADGESKEKEGGGEEVVEASWLLAVTLSFSSCSLSPFPLSLPPPIMASVDAPDARWLTGSPSSVRRLRLNDVCVVRLEGSKLEVNGALNGDGDDSDGVDEDVDEDDEEEDAEREADAAVDDCGRAGKEDAEVKDAEDDGREDSEEEEEEEEGTLPTELNIGTAGNGALASADLVSAASPAPPAPPRLAFDLSGSSILRVLAADSSVLFFSSSSFPPRAPLSRGSASDFTGVMAPPAPPSGHLRDGSKRPRSDGREEPGLEEERGELKEAEGMAREEMIGDGEGSVRRFCDNRGVRSSEARIRWAVWEEDSG